jgi:chromosome segregation ATPase
MSNDMGGYVTHGELASVLDGRLEPLKEIRDMLRDAMGDIRDGQVRIVEKIAELDTRVTRRMDISNGRHAKLENLADTIKATAVEAKEAVAEAQATAVEAKEAVAEAQASVAGLSRAVEGVQQTATRTEANSVETKTLATHIDQYGCCQMGRHEEIADALAQVGIVPTNREAPSKPWSRRQRGGLIAAFATSLLLGALTPYLVPAVEHLARWVRSW